MQVVLGLYIEKLIGVLKSRYEKRFAVGANERVNHGFYFKNHCVNDL